MPVGWRCTSRASISDNVATGWLAVSPRESDCIRFFTGPVGSATDSTSVFQASQCGHLPSQRGLVPPHSLQV